MTINSSSQKWLQSFANISKATPDQLQNLPGFGQVKVKNIKNAFDKPFRNQSTSSLTHLASQGNKGVLTNTHTSKHPQDNAVAKETSPPWDIELDITSEAEDSGGTNPNLPSRVDDAYHFDIELNLN